MPIEILPYHPAAASSLDARRAWGITAIYLLPIIVPMGIWTIALWGWTVKDPSQIVRPFYFGFTAAGGPLADMMAQPVVLMRPPDMLPWTTFHQMASPPIPPMLGAAFLIGWLFTALCTGARRWPIWLHLTLSALWWWVGCIEVTGRHI